MKTVAIAAALVAALAVRVAAQSLGDVAKKEEERRKQAAASGKVYTNKDLAPVPPSSAAPAPAGPVSADASAKDGDKPSTSQTDGKKGDADAKSAANSADSKAADGKGDKSKKDQAYWAERMKAARDAVDRDATLADAMQSRLNALATDFANRDDPAQRTAIERERQKASAELDRLKKQIVADRKAVSDLEDEARRAGVPPGWLR
jgi:hypothetical protein